MAPDVVAAHSSPSHGGVDAAGMSALMPVIEGSAKKPRDLSIDYLRTTLTLMVVAHHSMLAYTTWASFNREHVFRSTAPIVDSSRWVVLNYAENFNDVFFMSLMFFISGIYAYPAIRRHGALNFSRDRLLRLGLPFAVAVCGLMPLAFYPSWTLGNQSSGFASFYGHIAHIGFQVGPPWFIWVLLLFDLVLALLLYPGQQWLVLTEKLTRKLQTHSVAAFEAMLVLSGLVYLPLLSRYGFAAWTVLFTSPFAFQQARIALYALWFVAGILVGVPGIATGFLSRSGSLARNWKGWTIVCVVAYATLSILPRFLAHHGMVLANSKAIEAILWVFSCVASCFAFLAIYRGLEMRPSRLMNSLSRSAYVMYLVHYVFITWTQKALLPVPVHAGIKAAVVFVATVTFSWLMAQILIRIPVVKTII